jgi:hypothetical protein
MTEADAPYPHKIHLPRYETSPFRVMAPLTPPVRYINPFSLLRVPTAPPPRVHYNAARLELIAYPNVLSRHYAVLPC